MSLEIPRISVTSIGDFLESPYHFKYFHLEGRQKEPTDAMIEGRAFHLAVLEPHKFATDVVVKGRPIDGVRVLVLVAELKQFIEEGGYAVPKGAKKEDLVGVVTSMLAESSDKFKGVYTEAMWDEVCKNKIQLTESAYNRVLSMSESVRAHAFYKKYFSEGEKEMRLEGVIEGLKVVGRLDWFFWSEDLKAYVIPDLKKAASVKPRVFASKVAEMNYHVQMWTYGELVRQNYNKPCLPLLIGTMPMPPFITECFAPDSGTIDAGETLCRNALKRMKVCFETGRWDAYSSGNIVNLAVPNWALDKAADYEMPEEPIEEVEFN